MGVHRRRNNLFHQIPARDKHCSNSYSHLPQRGDKHRRVSLQSPDDCLQRSISFILRCRIRYHECPITLVLDRSAGAEAWEEDGAEEAAAGAAEVDMVVEGEGGNE